MSIAFLLTTVIVVVTPGTGVVYTLSAALSRGARASLIAAFGCTLGVLPQLAAAVTGLAALLYTSAVAFDVVRYAGVGYLLFLSWATLRDRDALVVEAATPVSAGRVIGRAVLINTLNPKLTLFFVAFLPQFVDPARPGETVRMLELGGFFVVATFIIFCLYGLSASAVRRHVLGRPRLVTALRRTFAGSFVALAARLALAAR